MSCALCNIYEGVVTTQNVRDIKGPVLSNGGVQDTVMYSPSVSVEGSNSANSVNRKLGVFDRNLDGTHALFYW